MKKINILTNKSVYAHFMQCKFHFESKFKAEDKILNRNLKERGKKLKTARKGSLKILLSCPLHTSGIWINHIMIICPSKR